MHKISKVSSLFKFIENHGNRPWFYRGEDCDFHDTKLTATLYRGVYQRNIFKQPVKFSDDSIIYKDNNNSYYKYNTWNSSLNAFKSFFKNLPNITNIEERNFMALCQHHSIPTPLLDISTSPLVALYFAAQKSKYNKNGRIYIFDSSHFIPLDNKILSYKYLLNCYQNKYFPLDLNDNRVLKYIVNSVADFAYSMNDHQKRYLLNLISKTLKELKLFLSHFDFKYDKKLCYEFRKAHLCNYYSLRRYLQNEKIGFRSNDPTLISGKYQEYLYYIDKIPQNRYKGKRNFWTASLTNITDVLCFLIYLAKGHSTDCYNVFVPNDLNFYTSCTVNWSRVRAQKSKFIIQIPFGNEFIPGFLNQNKTQSKKETTINNKTIIHKPKPVHVLEINNKKEILHELDNIGINEKSLFIDRDSIAHYIKNKYYI